MVERVVAGPMVLSSTVPVVEEPSVELVEVAGFASFQADVVAAEKPQAFLVPSAVKTWTVFSSVEQAWVVAVVEIEWADSSEVAKI